MAKRSIFVVAPDATVAYRWVTDDAAVMPDYDDTVAAVRRWRREQSGGRKQSGGREQSDERTQP